MRYLPSKKYQIKLCNVKRLFINTIHLKLFFNTNIIILPKIQRKSELIQMYIPVAYVLMNECNNQRK